MNAVVLTVKSCYVASTKYPRLAAEGKLNQLKPVVVWKMKVSLFFKILDGIKWYFGAIMTPKCLAGPPVSESKD